MTRLTFCWCEKVKHARVYGIEDGLEFLSVCWQPERNGWLTSVSTTSLAVEITGLMWNQPQGPDAGTQAGPALRAFRNPIVWARSCFCLDGVLCSRSGAIVHFRC